jgi:alkaline phosphatase D
MITHGVQSGDVVPGAAVVWTRADRPARMMVQVSHSPSFQQSWTVPGPVLTPETDFTGKVRVSGLSSTPRVHYRVLVEDLDTGLAGEPVTGSFTTAPKNRRSVRFVWVR